MTNVKYFFSKSTLMQRRYQVVISISFIALLTFISFLSSLDNGFTNWDDDIYVVANTLIKTISYDNLKSIFTSFNLSNYHPLVLLSFLLEYHFFQLDPFIYHLDNLILHIFNSLLVFYVIFMASRNVYISFIAATLFGIHPLHVESVAWVAERKDVLSTFFFLQAIICYLFYGKKQKRLYYFLALIIFLLALLSKAMIVTLPIVLLLFDYLLYRKLDRWCLLEKVPFFILSIIFGVLNIFAQKAGGVLVVKESFNVIYNLFIVSKSLVFYLTKTIVPLNLSAIYPYPYPYHKTINILSTEFLLSALFLFTLAIIVFYSRKWTRKIIFGSLFFFITILPVLKLIPLDDWAFAADRYMYIPSIGLFYLAGLAFYKIYSWEGIYENLKKVLSVLILSVIILSFAVITYQRNMIWKDSETLWLNVIENYPDSYLAHNKLGIFYYYEKGKDDIAIKEFKKARYRMWEAHHFLGLIYQRKGLLKEAIAEYKFVIMVKHGTADVYYNLGVIFTQLRSLEEAIEAFRNALLIDPEFKEAQLGLERAQYLKHLQKTSN